MGPPGNFSIWCPKALIRQAPCRYQNRGCRAQICWKVRVHGTLQQMVWPVHLVMVHHCFNKSELGTWNGLDCAFHNFCKLMPCIVNDFCNLNPSTEGPQASPGDLSLSWWGQGGRKLGEKLRTPRRGPTASPKIHSVSIAFEQVQVHVIINFEGPLSSTSHSTSFPCIRSNSQK